MTAMQQSLLIERLSAATLSMAERLQSLQGLILLLVAHTGADLDRANIHNATLMERVERLEERLTDLERKAILRNTYND